MKLLEGFVHRVDTELNHNGLEIKVFIMFCDKKGPMSCVYFPKSSIAKRMFHRFKLNEKVVCALNKNDEIVHVYKNIEEE